MLEIRDLNAFYGDAQALWNVTLDVPPGETTCILGPNGAGKSTIIACIAGLHPKLRGRITLDGTNLTTLPAHQVCAHGVAIVPEGRRVFAHMSVLDNLLLGAYRRPARAHHRHTLTDVFTLFPRLSARSTQPAGNLSGGEQQMLAIARALMALPRLLLLDEPSLGLAPVILDEVFDAIMEINTRGVTVLLVEQAIDRALDISTHAYLLTEGHITAHGPAADLRDSDAVRQGLLGR